MLYVTSACRYVLQCPMLICQLLYCTKCLCMVYQTCALSVERFTIDMLLVPRCTRHDVLQHMLPAVLVIALIQCCHVDAVHRSVALNFYVNYHVHACYTGVMKLLCCYSFDSVSGFGTSSGFTAPAGYNQQQQDANRRISAGSGISRYTFNGNYTLFCYTNDLLFIRILY
jgi:hypothetical protein